MNEFVKMLIYIGLYFIPIDVTLFLLLITIIKVCSIKVNNKCGSFEISIYIYVHVSCLLLFILAVYTASIYNLPFIVFHKYFT
jgi:hypothetical protein